MNIILPLIYLLIVIFPFGQLTKLPLNISQVNIYFHDLLIIFILLIWGINKFFKKKKIRFGYLTKPIFSFIILALFSYFLALPYYQSREAAVAFLYLARWISYSGLYFVLIDNLKNSKEEKQNILKLLLISCTTAAFLGLLQYIFIPDIRPLDAFGWDPHYYRVVGSYLDPGYTAMIFVLGLILITNNLLKKEKNIKKASFFKINFIFIYIALALTYTRSGYLAYLLAMLIFAWFKKNKKFFITVFLLGILTIFLLPRPGGEGVKLERKSTVLSRIFNWQKSIEISWDNPIFGTGFNFLRYAQKNYRFFNNEGWEVSHAGAGVDSSLLFVLTTTGVLGLISYLNLLKEILVNNYGKYKLVVFISSISLIIHSFFNNSLFYAWLMIWWWLLIGVCEVYKEKVNNKSFKDNK